MTALLALSPGPEGALSALEFRLLNDFQRDFPLLARPFAELARRLGVSEARVIEGLQALRQRGLISRVGAVFRPNVVGASALAALAVPTDRLESVAAQVSARVEINHNYAREHHFNLWFVATASSPAQLRADLREIELVCACGPLLVLPLLEQFHIDLGFGLVPGPTPFLHDPAAAQEVAAVTLSVAEQAFMSRLQHGLALTPQPFAALGWREADALALLARWTEVGVIKRFGVVVRHHELGFTANAMVVWNVPDALVSQVGRRLAASGQVSLCYRRPRCLPHWPYNLFCMIHGKDRRAVEARISALTRACGLAAYPQQILFSVRRFKQRGARYGAPGKLALKTEAAHGPD
jgi:DNA-binding Lrp family transcriptional regulator